MDSYINDIRTTANFKGITFSKYKKTNVLTALINSLLNEQIEQSCYWSAELICAGHFIDLWNTILLFMSKYIHLGNPKLAIYLDMRYNTFKKIVQDGYISNELSMRNNDTIRKLFCEIICILCTSSRKHKFEVIKLNKIDDFDMTKNAFRLKAPTVNYAQQSFVKGDPKELYIAINEFAYHISKESYNTINACYWVEWILEFETICKKRKEKMDCARRSFIPVNFKYQMDIVWILWDVILREINNKSNILIKIIKSLLNLFCLRFSPGVKKKRRFILYYTIALITENYNINIEIISNKTVISNIVTKMNVIYTQIKKLEEAPRTDYLFNNSIAPKKTNVEKTIDKIEKINKLDTIIRRVN
jgi:hypothetical protein